MPIVNIPENYTPSNFNYPEMTDAFRKSAQKVVGKDNVVETSPQLVGEDFSRYGQTTHKVPTVLFWLGTVSEEKINKGFLPGLHSPFYYPEPEKSLTTGIAVTSQFLLDLFNQSN
jgi:hippurate hydrolase